MTRVGTSAIMLGVAFLAYFYSRVIELGHAILMPWELF